MIPFIEDLKLTFGAATNNDNYVDLYVPADSMQNLAYNLAFDYQYNIVYDQQLYEGKSLEEADEIATAAGDVAGTAADANSSPSDYLVNVHVDVITRGEHDVGAKSLEGYGETQLLNKCANGVNCSETEHLVNRRIEFVVTR